MKRPHDERALGKSALALIEEAVHLLRVAPATVLWPYYLGAIPFVLGLLFFWTEMSGSAYAERHQAEAALAVALLFTWMKFWQTVFTGQLRARIGGDTPELPAWRAAVSTWVTQTWIQSTGLFLLPLAFLIVLPFGWVFAFYQNATAQPAGGLRARDAIRHAHRMALLFPKQNHAVLGLLTAFGLCVFLNWAMVCYLAPALAKLLFGIDSVFTRSGTHVFNTTFFAVALGLTYLSVDPMIKAVYTLRCFYGEAVETGDDLRAELRRVQVRSSRSLAVALALAFLCGGIGDARAQAAGESVPAGRPALAPAPVDPAQLDASIEKVIQQRKYAWRMPREKLSTETSEEGVISRFLTSVGETIRKFFNRVGELWRKLFPGNSRGAHLPSGSGFGAGSLVLLYGLLAIVLVGLAIFALRYVRLRRARPAPISAEAIQPVPDLADDNVGADQLAEDGWMRLGREMLAKGELRLAMRAFYLSSLAWLAEKNLVNLARFKSNHDYQRELARRAHALPGTVRGFGETVELFERVWYGSYPADVPLVEDFIRRVQHLREGGNPT